jgi:hypothetical protein
MKNIIAIVGFTAACIGASEMLSAKAVDCGVAKTIPVHPLTDIDQRYLMVAEEANPIKRVGVRLVTGSSPVWGAKMLNK